MTPPRGHRARPHTADVILEAWGPDLASCLEEAVAAAVATYAAGRRFPVVGRRAARIPAGSADSQLLGVLEELIFVLDTSEHVPVGAAVTTGADGSLEVSFAMAERAAVRGTGAAPKALSRSHLQVDAGPGRVSCRFLIDV